MSQFNLIKWIERQIDWSESTFGPGKRTEGNCRHIEKELTEIRQAPSDLMEWIDVVILAIDLAWRSGYSPESIVQALEDKQQINIARQWVRTPEDIPSEHAKLQADNAEHERDAARQSRARLVELVRYLRFGDKILTSRYSALNDEAQKITVERDALRAEVERLRKVAEAARRYLAVKKSWDNQLSELKELYAALADADKGTG